MFAVGKMLGPFACWACDTWYRRGINEQKRLSPSLLCPETKASSPLVSLAQFSLNDCVSECAWTLKDEARSLCLRPGFAGKAKEMDSDTVGQHPSQV